MKILAILFTTFFLAGSSITSALASSECENHKEMVNLDDDTLFRMTYVGVNSSGDWINETRKVSVGKSVGLCTIGAYLENGAYGHGFYESQLRIYRLSPLHASLDKASVVYSTQMKEDSYGYKYYDFDKNQDEITEVLKELRNLMNACACVASK